MNDDQQFGHQRTGRRSLGQCALAVYHGIGTPDDEQRLLAAGLAERVTIVRLTTEGDLLAKMAPAEAS